MAKDLWKLKKSRIHGNGMFAREAIPAGTRIIEYIGEKITKSESLKRCLAWEEAARKNGAGLVYIFDLNKRYDLDGNVPNNPPSMSGAAFLSTPHGILKRAMSSILTTVTRSNISWITPVDAGRKNASATLCQSPAASN